MNEFEKIALEYIEKLKTHKAIREIKNFSEGKYEIVEEVLSEIVVLSDRIELRMLDYYSNPKGVISCVTSYPFEDFLCKPEDLKWFFKEYKWIKKGEHENI